MHPESDSFSPPPARTIAHQDLYNSCLTDLKLPLAFPCTAAERSRQNAFKIYITASQSPNFPRPQRIRQKSFKRPARPAISPWPPLLPRCLPPCPSSAAPGPLHLGPAFTPLPPSFSDSRFSASLPHHPFQHVPPAPSTPCLPLLLSPRYLSPRHAVEPTTSAVCLSLPGARHLTTLAPRTGPALQAYSTDVC